MTVREYIKATIENFIVAEDKEVVGVRTIEFDIGVGIDKNNSIVVEPESSTRIKFSLEVKRS